MTERKRAEEQIKELAYHDALTGLPNRLLFNDRLSVAVAQAHRSASRLAILFLDLDRFKVINDSLGHSLGDRLLQEVAERLQAGVRQGDTVARLGGDEFILLLPGIGRAEDAAKVAEKILETLKFPVRLEDRELFVTASIGISLYPEDGFDVESLIKNADTAMYRAKEQGRDNFQLYTHAMNETAVERLGAGEQPAQGAARRPARPPLPAAARPGHRQGARRGGAAALEPPRARPGAPGRVPQPRGDHEPHRAHGALDPAHGLRAAPGRGRSRGTRR